MNADFKNIKRKILEANPGISEEFAEKTAIRLLQVGEVLLPNIREWIESKPFSDIRIRNKYCLNAVLKIRGNPTSPLDIADAIIALNAYAENETSEHLIWQKRL